MPKLGLPYITLNTWTSHRSSARSWSPRGGGLALSFLLVMTCLIVRMIHFTVPPAFPLTDLWDGTLVVAADPLGLFGRGWVHPSPPRMWHYYRVAPIHCWLSAAHSTPLNIVYQYVQARIQWCFSCLSLPPILPSAHPMHLSIHPSLPLAIYPSTLLSI